MICSLCGNQVDEFIQIKNKIYFECLSCRLVFLSKEFHLSHDQERDIYDFHQNDPKDQGYRKFLKPALDAVTQYVPPKAMGLDVGCGPGPTLSLMLSEQGFHVEIYDKFYYPEQSVFQQKYDFITCTEVIEHISELDAFIEKLLSCLKPKSHLIMMTKIFQDKQDFTTWYYKDDPTHISFLRVQTVHFIAKKYQLALKDLTGQMVVFQKSQ